MSRKTALILTTALTVFVIVVIGALAIRLGTARVDPATALATDVEAGVAPVATEVLREREALYRQLLREANAQLQQAYQRTEELQAQNAILLEREQVYQQRLNEANGLRQQAVLVAQAWPSGPAGQLQNTVVQSEDAREHGEHEEHEDDEHEEEQHERDDD